MAANEPLPEMTVYKAAVVYLHGYTRSWKATGDCTTHPRVFAGLVVDDLIRTRAGTSTPPELPEWNKTAKQIAPPLPRRNEWRLAREQEE